MPLLQTALTKALPVARTVRRRLDNPEVRAGRRLVERLQAGPLDVLYLGDSAAVFTAPDDADQRTLTQMLLDDLGTDVQVHAVAGGGYGPQLQEAYVRLVVPSGQRPLVLFPECIRLAYRAWTRHPVYGYERATRALLAADPNGPTWRIRAALPPHTEAQMREHDTRRHVTLAGKTTVGEHRVPLKDPRGHGLSDDEQQALLYAYHHGGRLEDGTGLPRTLALGATLRAHGFPVVAYQTPVPVERGTELLGDVLDDLVRLNFLDLDRAFAEGYGPHDVLQTGRSFGTSDFIDPTDASEHLNEHGRLRLAAILSAAVRERLAQPTSR